MLLPLAFSFHAIFHGVRVFFDNLANVSWTFLAVAAFVQLLKIGCAGRAWQNSITASYPDKRASYPMVFGALCAGSGVGAIVPAHGGDAVRVVIVKRRMPGSTYTTIASTLLVRAPFDILVALSLFLLLFAEGVLPGHSLLPHLPAFDFSWFFGHPRQTVFIAGTIILLLTALVLWAWTTIQEFKERVRQGLNGLLDWRYYLRHIVPWQAADWTLRIVTIFFALLAFHMPATVYNSLLAQGTANLSTLLPISPSGIGTEQALLVSVLHGVAPDSLIIAFSVGTRLMMILINVLLGFAAILYFFGTFRYQRYVSEEQSRTQGKKRVRAD
ncbi:MAG: lysylphosphatidylglycerol synthase transmembrane domain-containing protein [Gaiellaceae bacterium]